MEDGKAETDIIALLGCERKLDMKPNAKGLTELDRAESAAHSKDGTPAETEFDLLRNTAAHKFDIPDEAWSLISRELISVCRAAKDSTELPSSPTPRQRMVNISS